MDFARSDIQTMLIDSASRLLSSQADVEQWRARRDADAPFDAARWAQFAELGWLALMVPEEAGGLGGSAEDMALLHIELGRALATEPVVSSAVIAAHVLTQAADDAATALAGEVAAGSRVLALAHLEPGQDTLDVDARATSARRSGDGWWLDGAKQMVIDAPGAQQLIISATIAGEEGTALFLVDADAPGVKAEPYRLVDGTRAADVRLDDVALPSTALIAGTNQGAALLAEAIDKGQIALMAQAVGSMEACLGLCGDYARERRQFGVPIGSFQAIQHMLSDMFVAANQARSILYHAVSATHGDAASRRAAVCAARIIVGEASLLIARSGIQIHGGYGITDEYAIGHHYRRLMVLEKLFGDVTDHLGRFADLALAD